MEMKILCTLVIAILLLGLQSACAAPQDTVNNVTTSAKQTLDNASATANHTAQEVQQTLNPIQSILSSINSIIQQVQQIFSILGGGQ